MPAKKPPRSTRNQYNDEFKKQAVERAEKEGVAATAKALGLNENQIYAWRQKLLATKEETQEQRQLREEVMRLKKENARLDEENAFLKKAAAYFAKQPK